MKIIRVFPRKTNLTPNDQDVRFGMPGFFDQADEIHISIVFTYDMRKAEYLAGQWQHIAPVKIGGPATGEKSGIFIPGMYLRVGAVITSRGCNNHCWFCSVPRREGPVRELPITDGWNVLDDNLLACSPGHINAVFAMLKRQPEYPLFTGGLEAKLMTADIASKLHDVKPKVAYFAYDTEDDLDPLVAAGDLLLNAGFTRSHHTLRAYVLCGFPRDTFEKAEKRFLQAWDAGFLPMAMLYRDKSGHRSQEWISWSWQWCRSMTSAANCRKRSSRKSRSSKIYIT